MSTLLFRSTDIADLLDALKPEDKLMLVGDQGVYIMSFAQDPANRKIVYAIGCDPTKNSEWYETKRAVFGGDDGADEIGTAAALRKFVVKKGFMKVILTPTQIKIST